MVLSKRRSKRPSPPGADPFDASNILATLTELHSSARWRRFSGDLTLDDLYRHGRRFAKLTSRAIARGTYRFAPAQPYTALIAGKERVLYRSTALDSVVERLLARWLSLLAEPLFTPSLYSYRRGFSAPRAIRELRQFIKAHRHSTPSVKDRGLWILRRDISAYGDSIAVGPNSALWGQIDRVLQSAAGPQVKQARVLLEQLLRRHCCHDDAQYCLAVGSATGSPLQPLVNNLYLSQIDAQLARQDGFYARFGDDLLFASASAEVSQRVAALLDRQIAALGLRYSATKCQDLFVNGAGRPPPGPPGWRAASSVDFLGVRVAFAGGVSLTRHKWRRLVSLCEGRVRRLAPTLTGQPTAAQVSRIGQLLRRSLDPQDALCLPHADLLLSVVDDRQQLHDFDERQRRLAAELCTGRRGVRAFRQLAPRKLHEFGLPSVTARRNRGDWSAR